jgi:S-DNA-T family DNA segregation ATPase FtsK/SpoIIIE
LSRDPYRRYQRQMRRTYRRHGGYPVIIPAPYEPAALIALAALGRLAFRHRSAFLPFAIAGAVYVTAAVMHRDHPGAWPWVTAATVTAAFILGIPHRLIWPGLPGRLEAGLVTRAWEACGISRLPERIYVTVTVAAAGGWLSAGTVTGPTARPLPGIAGIATVILGVPWWAHRRRRARVRIARTVQAWPGMADRMGLPGSRIASAEGDRWGFTARVILRKGTTAAQAITQVPAIESGLGVQPGSVRALPDPVRADRVILRVMEADPHATPIPWPGVRAATITRPVALGLFEDGRPAAVLLLRRNVLVGGTTGAGKSGLVNVILAALAACPDVLIWGVDLKGGMELQPWAGCLDRLATTPDDAAGLFRDAITELDRRAALLAGQGARVWGPSPQMPALVIVVDEYAEMPPDARDSADSVARRGRAVAVNLLAATQRPTQEAMGRNAVRSQMDVRICLRVRERRDTDLILGQGALQSGWHPHALTQPGAFLLSDPEHTAPERARGYLITDAQVTAHARTHGRAALPRAAPAAAQPRRDGPAGSGGSDGPGGPAAALRAALEAAGPDGAAPADLMAATGMSRPTLYRHLQALAAAGLAVRSARGRWRAATPAGRQ